MALNCEGGFLDRLGPPHLTTSPNYCSSYAYVHAVPYTPANQEKRHYTFRALTWRRHRRSQLTRDSP